MNTLLWMLIGMGFDQFALLLAHFFGYKDAGYYVTLKYDMTKQTEVKGPYNTRNEALAVVEPHNTSYHTDARWEALLTRPSDTVVPPDGFSLN